MTIPELRELLAEVASSGVEHEAPRYVVVQIDYATWREVLKFRRSEAPRPESDR